MKRGRIAMWVLGLATAGLLLLAAEPTFAGTAPMVFKTSTSQSGDISPNNTVSGTCGSSYIFGFTDGYAFDADYGVSSSVGPILYGAYTVWWGDGYSYGSGIPPNSGTWSSSYSHTYAIQPNAYYAYMTGYVETIPAACTILNPTVYLQVPSYQEWTAQ